MESAIPLIVRALIQKYGEQAADAAANRARVLESCGDREASGYWYVVRQQIEAAGHSASFRRREFSNPDSGAIAAAREAAFGDGARRPENDPFAEED